MDTEARIRLIVSKILAINPLEISSLSRLNELGADSLSIIEIMMSIEENFTIKIHDLDMASITTFGNLVDYVVTKVE